MNLLLAQGGQQNETIAALNQEIKDSKNSAALLEIQRNSLLQMKNLLLGQAPPDSMQKCVPSSGILKAYLDFVATKSSAFTALAVSLPCDGNLVSAWAGSNVDQTTADGNALKSCNHQMSVSGACIIVYRGNEMVTEIN